MGPQRPKFSVETQDLTDFARSIGTAADQLVAPDRSLGNGAAIAPSEFQASKATADGLPNLMHALAQWKMGMGGSVKFNAAFTTNAATAIQGQDVRTADTMRAAVDKAQHDVPRYDQPPAPGPTAPPGPGH